MRYLHFTDESYRFNVSISDRCYDHKPSKNDYTHMSFCVENVTMQEIIDKVSAGYSICHLFNNKRRLKKNFVGSYCIFIDVDDSQVSMKDFIDNAKMKPSFAYTTSSNGVKGYRFRLGYVFDDMIETEDLYKDIYSAIVHKINLSNTKDNCGSVCNQIMNGNSSNNIETYCSFNVFRLNQFMQNVLLR